MEDNVTRKIDLFFSKYPSAVYENEHVILQPGMEIKEIYYIKSGNVRLYVNSPDGQRLTLQIFRPQAFIPLILFLNEKQNNYTFQSIGKTVVNIAPVNEVIAFIKNDPEILFDIATRLSHAVAGLLKKQELATFDDAYNRILSLLIYFAEKFGENRSQECIINLSLTHADIASFLGLQRETVTRKLGLLVEKRLIKHEGEFIVFPQLVAAKRELLK